MLLSMLLFANPAYAEPAPLFGPPQRLSANGEEINVPQGYSAPFLADYDGDGLNDLWVGQIDKARLNVFRNLGTATTPRYAQSVFLKAQGEECRVPGG